MESKPMEDNKPKQESKQAIPNSDIRQEFGKWSVFKTLGGRKVFIGIKPTREEAEKLWGSK